jgi:hypothetical protein
MKARLPPQKPGFSLPQVSGSGGVGGNMKTGVGTGVTASRNATGVEVATEEPGPTETTAWTGGGVTTPASGNDARTMPARRRAPRRPVVAR